jgi:ABC-2 type transport system permease protein
MPLVLGIFAVLAGSGLVVSDEENGTLDLILAHPVSRTMLFFGRSLAFLAETFLIFAIVWLGFIITMIWSDLDVGAGELTLPFLSLLGVMVFFGGMALLLSLVLPSRRMAAMLAGLILVASYFITSLSRLSTEESLLARISPLKYYQGGDAISGLNWAWYFGLFGFALVFTLLAWWRFERRDIRVGGEGGWRVNLPWRKAVQEGI